MEKKYRQNLIVEIAEKSKLDAKITELLVNRGIDSQSKVQKFLHAGKENFSDPFKISGIKLAADRISEAVSLNQPIVIYGDYDADGICAVSMLYLCLKDAGANVNWYIPERKDGYGISVEAIEKVAEEFFPDLIVTCDCGITAKSEVEYIISLGTDVIITDHHEPPADLPDCIIVNPKLDEIEELKNLCGAGVVLKLIQAIFGMEKSLEYCDLAALATVADSVPLLFENRDIVAFGLKVLNSNTRPGLIALADKFNFKNKYNSQTLAYLLAPRINAAGRIGEAKKAITLLTENDADVLEEIAGELERANAERQEICDKIINSLIISDKLKEQIYNSIIILYDKDYPIGVLGILAAKIVDKFNRPVFVFTKSEGFLKGSGRSVKCVNLHELLTFMEPILTKFGGHSQAAGVTIEENKLKAFKESANRFLKDTKCNRISEEFDLEINASDLNLNFAESLNMLEPYGVSNPRPKFLIKNEICEITPLKNFPVHLNVKIEDKIITAFNFAKKSDLFYSPCKKSLFVDVLENDYKDVKSVKTVLKSVVLNDDENLKDFIIPRYFSIISNTTNLDNTYKIVHSFDKLIEKNYGNLFISFDKNNFDKFSLDTEKAIFNVTHNNNNNKIILAPNLEIDFSFYNRIFFLENPKDIVNKFYFNKSAEIFAQDENLSFAQLETLDFTREAFIKYYKLILNNYLNLKYTDDINCIYNYFYSIDETINPVQFALCFYTFVDLKILTIDTKSSKILLQNNKVDLMCSGFLNKIQQLKKQ